MSFFNHNGLKGASEWKHKDFYNEWLVAVNGEILQLKIDFSEGYVDF